MKANTSPDNDEIIRALMDADTEYITIVGKSWDLHVKDALRVSLDTNLKMIDRTISLFEEIRQKKYFLTQSISLTDTKIMRTYAMQVIKAAYNAGADVIVLCDTNGGSMPYEIDDIVTGRVHSSINAVLGIHTHNDTELGCCQYPHGCEGRMHPCTGNGQRLRRTMWKREPLFHYSQCDFQNGPQRD